MLLKPFNSFCRKIHLNLIQICTIPLDTAKVRLQLQKSAATGDAIALPKYRGMLGTVATIAREEGLAALWKGIVPGLHRQCLFGGLRIGLYEPVSLALKLLTLTYDIGLLVNIFLCLVRIWVSKN